MMESNHRQGLVGVPVEAIPHERDPPPRRPSPSSPPAVPYWLAGYKGEPPQQNIAHSSVLKDMVLEISSSQAV